VKGFAGNATNNSFAVYGNASLWTPAASIFNVGVYGTAPGLPLGSPAPLPGTGSFAGYFNGDLGYTGNIWLISDSTLKTQIQPINNSDSILRLLNSYTYYFDTAQLENSVNVSHAMQYGLMAQQVERVAPALVLNTIIPATFDSVGNIRNPARPVKMLNSMGIIPLLVKSFQQLDSTNQALQSQLSALQDQVNGCCNSHRSSAPQDTTSQQNQNQNQVQAIAIDVTLSNVKGIILNQNQPNPFSENTTITFVIPDNIKSAQIMFYDNTGVILKAVEVKERGRGQLNVFAQDLSSGIYSYSLIADGKLIETKKMVCNK
jgi:hypothetical protein